MNRHHKTKGSSQIKIILSNTHTHSQTHTHTNIYTNVHMYIHTGACAHTYTSLSLALMHTHTHTHAYTSLSISHFLPFSAFILYSSKNFVFIYTVINLLVLVFLFINYLCVQRRYWLSRQKAKTTCMGGPAIPLVVRFTHTHPHTYTHIIRGKVKVSDCSIKW